MTVTMTTAPAGDASSALPLLHTALSRSTSPVVQRLGTAIVVGATLARAARTTAAAARRAFEFHVRVSSDDQLYRGVHAWVLELIPPGAGRSLRVETVRGDQPTHPGDTGSGRDDGFRMLYDGQRAQTVTVDGHRITVHLERENVAGGERRSLYSYELVFTAGTQAGRDAVVRHLRRLHAAENTAPPTLRVAESWGDWRRMTDVPVRALESVVLPAGEREHLEDDLRRFLAAEAEYARWGTPWHRGYLFSGPPGSGKTSMATALAFAFGLDVYYLSLSSTRDDDALMRNLLNVDRRSVLILEDVDVVHAARERTDSGGGVTLAGLLNALDGMVTPHGLVTILTTNRRDVLDPALLRPGRVDYEWTSTALTAEQAHRLASHFGHAIHPDQWAGQSPAALVAHLKDQENP